MLASKACTTVTSARRTLRSSAPCPSGTQQASRGKTLVSCSTKRKSKMAYEEDKSEGFVGRVVEEAAASSHGLFTDNFKNALAEALERQGTNSLLQGQEKINDEYQLSGQEEVLKAAIMASKSTLLKLQLVKTEVEKAIEVENKQVERLQFALEKARSDAAYYRGLQNMMNDSD